MRGKKQEKKKTTQNIKRREKKNIIKDGGGSGGGGGTNLQTQLHFFLQWKLYPSMWKSSAGIYALKISSKEKQGDYGCLAFSVGS